MRFPRFLSLLLLGSAVGLGSAAERSLPLDCLPDGVTSWEAAGPFPESRFGAPFLPGTVLGPPGESLPYQGALTVASLGFGGRATVEFREIEIEDRPGPDFIVFENVFFTLPLPASGADDFSVFAEPGIVEVSADGEQWFAFPFDADALSELTQSPGSTTAIDRDLYNRLVGLAGITPSFTGNWTVANAPDTFDPSGDGGVSGAGGDAFDLADVGLSAARFVRVTDADTRVGFAGSAEGFDLDAVVALHGKPIPPSAPDTDGDGLSDAAEISLYMTSPTVADTDGDGVDDGREVASCRNPDGTGNEPWFLPEARLWLIGEECTEVRWSYLGAGRLYDLLRAKLDELTTLGAFVDLGPTDCLVDDNLNLRWGCDSDPLLPGEGFVYLVRSDGDPDWGRSSDFTPRGSGGECP